MSDIDGMEFLQWYCDLWGILIIVMVEKCVYLDIWKWNIFPLFQIPNDLAHFSNFDSLGEIVKKMCKFSPTANKTEVSPLKSTPSISYTLCKVDIFDIHLYFICSWIRKDQQGKYKSNFLMIESFDCVFLSGNWCCDY